MKSCLRTAILLLTALLPASSRADSPSTGSLRIQGVASVVCRARTADLHEVPGKAGVVRFVGTVEEICNGSGYQVWLEHTQGIEGVVIVDGEPFALDSSGSTLISQSVRPERRKRTLDLHFKETTVPASVSVRLQPSF